MSGETGKNVTKKMNDLYEIILDRKNLTAFSKEVDILDRFLQVFILRWKIDIHDMFFHSTGAVPIGFEEYTFLVQEIMQFFSTP